MVVYLQHAAALVLVVEVEAALVVPVELHAAGGLLDNVSVRDEAENSVRKQIRNHNVCSELCSVLDSGVSAQIHSPVHEQMTWFAKCHTAESASDSYAGIINYSELILELSKINLINSLKIVVPGYKGGDRIRLILPISSQSLLTV